MAISSRPKNSFWKPPWLPGCTMQATEGVSRPAGRKECRGFRWVKEGWEAAGEWAVANGPAVGPRSLCSSDPAHRRGSQSPRRPALASASCSDARAGAGGLSATCQPRDRGLSRPTVMPPPAPPAAGPWAASLHRAPQAIHYALHDPLVQGAPRTLSPTPQLPCLGEPRPAHQL